MSEIDFLDLEETDAVYGSLFNMMIKEAFRDNKNFIVARVKSRGTDKYDNSRVPRDPDYEEESQSILRKEGPVLTNHFNIYSIVKLIFKKRGEEFVGRFHSECSVTALNPLTNNRLIGEVEFFFIENPYLKI